MNKSIYLASLCALARVGFALPAQAQNLEPGNYAGISWDGAPCSFSVEKVVSSNRNAVAQLSIGGEKLVLGSVKRRLLSMDAIRNRCHRNFSYEKPLDFSLNGNSRKFLSAVSLGRRITNASPQEYYEEGGVEQRLLWPAHTAVISLETQEDCRVPKSLKVSVLGTVTFNGKDPRGYFSTYLNCGELRRVGP